MTKSPLQFAKDFARFRGQIASLPEGDAQLLLALDFWREMRDYRGDAAYQSYFDEYLPLLQSLVTPHNLIDLTINELERLRDTIAEIDCEKTQIVALELAKKYFYVGAIEKGLKELSPSPLTPLPRGERRDVGQVYSGPDEGAEGAGGNPFLPDHAAGEHCQEGIPDGAREGIPDVAKTPSPLTPLPQGEGRDVGQVYSGPDEGTAGQTPSGVGQVYSGPDEGTACQAPSRLDLRDLEFTNEFAAFQTLCARANEANHPLAATLNDILTEWQGEREAAYHDRARCLFVERDDGGRTIRGRMRTLTGHIELFGKSATTDEITFEGAIKTPDDPFVGVAYDACRAVRAHFDVTGLKGQGSHFYHAHYAIEDTSQTFTGDSIGLAFALLAYVQLLRPEVLRLDRLLSGEVAFTGGVAANGALTAVNDSTLGQKIERAFFSPVKYLVLPEANTTLAREHLDRLRQSYPRRHLHLIAAERLGDIVEDHNIVRSEKVCIGEFVAKKAAKYGKMTKVQVPLLAVLAYLLLCLVYPKAWVGFDWNPASAAVDVQSNKLVVKNSSGNILWKKSFTDKLLHTSSTAVSDLGNNDTNEVLFMPAFTVRNTDRGWFFVYSNKGALLFQRYGGLSEQYPDSLVIPLLECEWLNVISYRGKQVIISEMNSNDPMRSYIRLWDEKGDSLGGYVNQGGTHFCLARDIDSDSVPELFFACYNNPESAVALLVLDPDSIWGIGPPYPTEGNSQRDVRRGSQLAYIVFPVTDLGRCDLRTPFNDPATDPIREDKEGEIKFHVCESPEYDGNCQVIYHFDYDLSLKKVSLTGQFETRRRELLQESSLEPIDMAVYLNQLASRARYWTDIGWVPARTSSP